MLGDVGVAGAGKLNEVIGQNLDLTGAPASPRLDYSGAPAIPADYEGTRKSVIDAMMSRANEDYATASDESNSNLIAAGIRPGSKAYADRQQMIERSRNDARQQAEIAGGNAAAQAYGVNAGRRAAGVGEANTQFQTGIQSRKDAIAETLLQRQTPLNEVTALMSGSQVANPFAVPGAAQNSSIPQTPIFGAAQAQGMADQNIYNQGVASSNSQIGGLASLGGAAMMATSMF